jgi:hypothetical protein
MSRRAVSGRALNEHLLYYFGTGDGLRFASTGAPAETFHLLTESKDRLLTEAGDFLDIEHV